MATVMCTDVAANPLLICIFIGQNQLGPTGKGSFQKHHVVILGFHHCICAYLKRQQDIEFLYRGIWCNMQK